MALKSGRSNADDVQALPEPSSAQGSPESNKLPGLIKDDASVMGYGFAHGITMVEVESLRLVDVEGRDGITGHHTRASGSDRKNLHQIIIPLPVQNGSGIDLVRDSLIMG